MSSVFALLELPRRCSKTSPSSEGSDTGTADGRWFTSQSDGFTRYLEGFSSHHRGWYPTNRKVAALPLGKVGNFYQCTAGAICDRFSLQNGQPMEEPYLKARGPANQIQSGSLNSSKLSG